LEIAALKTGLYRLTKDVANPNGDRRVKHDWRRLPLIKAGTKFEVEVRTAEVEGTGKTRFYAVLARVGTYKIASATLHEAVFKAVVEALEPAERTLADYVRASSGETILKKLIANGKITLADVAEVVGEENDLAPLLEA
jgi:hypothetical protein